MKKTLRSDKKLGRLHRSVGEMLRDRRRRFRDLPAYQEKKGGSDDYTTRTWDEFFADISRVGASLIKLGIEKGDVLAIYSRNREEMLVFELAAMSINAIACPIFSEYPANQLDYVLEHSGAKFLAVSDEPHLRVVRACGAHRKIEGIFVMDAFRAMGPKAVPFDRLYRICGESESMRGGPNPCPESPCGCLELFEKRLKAARPDDPCLLMYTSGTTGRPKGALLSHRNILSQRKAIELLWKLKPGGRVLAYLPWHHSFGGIFELFGAIYSGACLTRDESYGKDLKLLVENYKRVKPTIYFSVPRIHQALVEEAKRSKKAERDIFHTELKFVFTAAAALPKHVSDYFEKKKIPVVEGWGLTETSPCVTVTPFKWKRSTGAVGRPLPGVAVRIAGDGEILVKGPNVMLRYHNDPKRSANVLCGGWFHTGDYGEIRNGGLVLKCRIDGMFKLTNGEMVISQNIENTLVACPLIQYAVVVGSGRDFVGALIFPNLRALAAAARRRGIRVSGNGGLLKNARIVSLLTDEVRKASLTVGEKYARPKAFVLVSEEPSLANGELTPTMKVVKSKVLENYAGDIEAIFRTSSGDRKQKRPVVRL